ncbi:MAG TPA: hypothetical protein VK762_32850 [Polyangiaceae bacterium]|nr:hypothetical protein [Polyangiaceae bacterium]
MLIRDYKITQFDQSLVEIAARFHVPDVRVILEANQDEFPTGSEDVTKMAPRLVGQVIKIPFPDNYAALWVWGTYTAVGGESLAKVCAKMNKDPRIDPRQKGNLATTPPWLTPDYLLNLFENAEVRGGHGADASAVSLAPGEIVHIPFPPVATRKRVIPTSPGLPTTFEVDPAWVDELAAVYESIRLRSRQFELQINALRELQRLGLGEVMRLVGMRRVLTVLKDHPHKPAQLLTSEMAQLPAVSKALDKLHDSAMEKLYGSILEAERKPALDAAMALGRSIIQSLRSKEFFELTKTLRTNAARFPRRINEVCAVLSYALQVLLDSPLGEEIAPDIEDTVKYVAGINPVDPGPLASVDKNLAQAVQKVPKGPAPATALGVVTSLVRNAGGLATASVGNLPGPSTLAVGLFRTYALRSASRILAAGKTVTTVEVTTETATLVAFARNAFAENDAAGEEIMIAISEVRRTVTVTTTTTVAANQAEVLARYDRIVAGRFMGTPAWTTGITVTGLFVLAFSIANMWQSGANQTDVTAAIGGGVTGALGAVQLFELVESATLKTIGRSVAILGVALAGYQWYKDSAAGADTTSDKLATLGSVLLAASLVPEPFAPVLAVLGGIATVSSIVYSLVQDEVVRNLFRTKAKIWFLGQTRTFKTGPRYLAQEGALKGAADALENAVLDADFFDIDEGQRSVLSKIVSSASEVDMLVGL